MGSFGETLKRLREKKGYSQVDLAERAGMNQFGVAKLEQGQRKPTWESVQALAAALGVSCEAFAEPKAEASPEEPKPTRKPPKK